MTQKKDPRTKLDSLVGEFASELGATLHEHPDLVESDIELPELPQSLRSRQALVVVAGAHYKEDLEMLRGYIKEYKPVLIGVDTGADALLDARLTPDIIVGDLNSVADASANCGALLLAHSPDEDGSAGTERMKSQELKYHKLPTLGSNRDAGLLVADSLLYRRQFSNWFLAGLALAGLFALFVALMATAAGQTFLGLLGAQFDGFFSWIGHLFSW